MRLLRQIEGVSTGSDLVGQGLVFACGTAPKRLTPVSEGTCIRVFSVLGAVSLRREERPVEGFALVLNELLVSNPHKGLKVVLSV